MWTIEDHFKVIIGGNTYIDVTNLIVYKGKTLFTLKRHDDNGELGIYFEIYDAKGKHVASVKRNQIYQTASGKELYLLEGSMDELTLREKATAQAVCQVRRKNATPAELEVSVRLHTPDGFLFNATPDSTNLSGGIRISGSVISKCATGIRIA